jgi:PAS domain S-box-containing protein
MNPTTLSNATMRVSRALALLALLIGIAVLTCWAYDFAWLRPFFALVMTPLAAVCVVLLSLSCLLASAPGRATGIAGQAFALCALALALQAIAQTGFDIYLDTDLALFPAVVERVFAVGFEYPGRMAGATSLMFAAAACALLVARSYSKVSASIYVFAAGLGLLLVSISLVGFVLGSDVLASLGLDRTPTTSATVTAGIVIGATLLQRQDTGWLPVLLGPSSAGRSARWPFFGSTLAPLAFALLALAGVRAGYYGLNFAFALLVAATCVGLSMLVLWNAARQERADTRATRARDAMQLASNRLRLAKSATGIQMWEWTPTTREWFSVDGEERLDPSTNEDLDEGLARCLRDGTAEFEFKYRRPGREEAWLLAKCWREQRDNVALVAGITLDINERKLAAIALEASETRLALAARAMPGFVYDWNYASGKILRTSGIEQMLGFRGAEVSPINHWWEELVHPEDRALSRPARVARAAGPESDIESLSCEYRVRHRNGGYVWIWDHCILVRDAENRVVRVIGSVLDITERKEAVARLAASEHRFKAALLATAGIIWTRNAEGRAVGEQTSWSAFTGQTTEELQGMGWLKAIHPDDVDATLEGWKKSLASGDDLILVQRVRRRDGAYRTFSVHAVPVADERGQIVEWVGSHTDVTEQREAVEHASETLRRLQLALDAATVGMWDWDLDTDRMTWTRQTHLITGISEAEFQGEAAQFFSLLRPADRDYAALFRREVARPEDVKELELEIRRPDGTVRWLQNRITSLADASGHARRIVGTVRDITQRKEFEVEREALLTAERAARTELGAAAQAKDEFLATISHELRTPLNAILGWTTLLQRPNVDTATIVDGLKVIERNARAQTQLLGDLLDANQLMSGKLSLHFEPMDLNDAVRATLDSLRVLIATRKVRIESSLTEAQLHVMGDSGRLQQIASNLISNALKFTPAEGVVSILTGGDAESVHLEVRDSGEGISAEFLPHIFEKFRQADGGSARKHAGLGLGLAITKQLVESHGGTIAVESDGKGKGATFRVRLPRLRPGVSEADEVVLEHRPKTNDKPLAGLRILAVDDETDSREYLARLLAEQGAEIVSVSSAAEALEELAPERTPFDLLVSDIGMPGSTGYDLIESIRAKLRLDARHLPAVALTAFSRPQDTATAIHKGFQKHLAKPVQVGRLIGAIRQLTGLNRVQPEASTRKH